jgi:hypothetical protein
MTFPLDYFLGLEVLARRFFVVSNGFMLSKGFEFVGTFGFWLVGGFWEGGLGPPRVGLKSYVCVIGPLLSADPDFFISLFKNFLL